MKITAGITKGLLYILAILLVSLIASQHSLYAASDRVNFSRTYQQESLTSIPEILPNHPRLFLRSTSWSNGPSLADLKTVRDREPWKTWLRQKTQGSPTQGWALRYLLTQEESLIPPIIDYMKKVKYWPGYLATVAVCYDWIYHSPSFSSEDKIIIEKKMVQMAEQAITAGEEYNDMWSHFAYRPAVDIAFAGLALWGHRPEAEKYIRYGGGYIKKNFFIGWQRTGGAYQGGWVYYSQGAQALVEFVAAWSSATKENLYEEIAKNYGNWLIEHMYYLIYATYPDKTLVDTAGFSYTPRITGFNSTLIIAAAYQNKDGIAYLRRLGGDLTHWEYDWWPYLFFTPQLRNFPVETPEMLLTRLWGRNGVGYVQMRSGWKEGDSIIDFKCGDYFWSHTFLNQNSFTIYRKGRLVIQSGIYADVHYGGPFMTNYYRRTIGSNSILVGMPEEKFYYFNKWFNEPGGQREIYLPPPEGNPETCFTHAEYLSRLNSRNHFETGDIKAFEVTDRYSYVCGDATMAYNNPTFSYPENKPKIDLFTRQLVFLDKKYLIIFDKVNSLSPEYEKKWLLHSIGEPQFGEKPVQVEYPGHQEVYKSGTVRIDNQGGTLYCQTMFPDEFLIRKVGGSATVTAAKADAGNKGNAVLRTTIEGKYARVSPTIASDGAQKEDWIIEFIDQEHFKIRGSITGEDGMGSQKDSMFISNSQSIFFLKDNWSGVAQEGDKFYFSVTSPSHRFWANGKNQKPSMKQFIDVLKVGSHIDPGNWRIEVFPRKKEKFDTFLHFLYPCDRDTPNPPLAKGVVTSDNIMKGLSVDNWIVLFRNKGTIDHDIKYDIKNRDNTMNLLLDMKPEKPYMVNIIKGASESHKQRIVSSKEGTLFFTANDPCRIKIEPL